MNTKELSIVSYNVQEFFDGKKDGCEYDDYKKGSWGIEPYKERLNRLCQVIRVLKSDVYVFQEIENEEILQDISNYLAGDSWKQKDLLSYSCFSKTPGSAIGIAVFSKYPLSDVKIHSLDIRSEQNTMPSMRPLLQVTVNVDERKICLLANHWKSKSGGEEISEVWRNWQESVLANVIYDETDKFSDFIICGDYNRDLEEFCFEGKNVVLRNFPGFCQNIKVFSGWFTDGRTSKSDYGSYYFDGTWEKIDHIFYTGNLSCRYFGPQQNSLWTDEKGMPFEYRISNGNGFSDHLPVKAIFEY